MRGMAGVIGFLVMSAYVTFFIRPQFQAVHEALQEDAGILADELPAIERIAPELAALRPEFQLRVAPALERAAYCYGRKANSDRPLARGKALLWDVATNDFSPAHAQLPPDIRASNPNEEFTAFLIVKQERKRLSGDYFESGWGPKKKDEIGVPSFRVDTEIAVVTLPNAEPRCRFVVEGSVPPGWINNGSAMKEVVGSWKERVLQFVTTSMNGKGPTASVPYGDQMRLLVDEARPALLSCQKRDDWPKHLPPKAIVWDAQRNVPHTAHGKLLPMLQWLPENDAACVVAFVMDEHFVPASNGGGGGRYDLTVNLVQLPGPVPVGAYTVRGEDWSDPRQAGQSWMDRDLNDPLRFWVGQLFPREKSVTKSIAPTKTKPATTTTNRPKPAKPTKPTVTPSKSWPTLPPAGNGKTKAK